MLIVLAFSFIWGAYAPAAAADFVDITRPFIRYIEDAGFPEKMYGEGVFQYQAYDGANAILFGVQDDYRVSPLMVVGGRFGFMSWSPDEGDGESGLVDLDVFGKYLLMDGPTTKMAAGVLLNLPIGSDKILGNSTFDIEAFGAMRYALEKMVILGNFGFRLNGDYEIDTGFGTFDVDGELSILFGGGMLYPVNENVTITGEFTFETERYDGADGPIQLTPGVDYTLASGLKLRGALALGLSDGAPDFMLQAGAAKNF